MQAAFAPFCAIKGKSDAKIVACIHWSLKYLRAQHLHFRASDLTEALEHICGIENVQSGMYLLRSEFS
jgi:hypothetical protein